MQKKNTTKDAEEVYVCPRAGVINPLAYRVIETDVGLIGEDIDRGDDVYVLTLAAVGDGDLAAVETVDGVFVRFVHWLADSTGKLLVRLESANPEVAPMIYDCDESRPDMKGPIVWVCKQGDHSRCFARVRRWRDSLDTLSIEPPRKKEARGGEKSQRARLLKFPTSRKKGGAR